MLGKFLRGLDLTLIVLLSNLVSYYNVFTSTLRLNRGGLGEAQINVAAVWHPFLCEFLLHTQFLCSLITLACMLILVLCVKIFFAPLLLQYDGSPGNCPHMIQDALESLS